MQSPYLDFFCAAAAIGMGATVIWARNVYDGYVVGSRKRDRELNDRLDTIVNLGFGNAGLKFQTRGNPLFSSHSPER